MKIKNLTPDVQKLVVKEITGEKKRYDIYVVPHGTTDIDRMVIIEPADLSGIFEIVGSCTPIIVSSEVKATPDEVTPPGVDDQDHDEVDNPPVVETPPAQEQETGDTFICDICGAEFGSARGLASHKNRTHSNN